MNIRNEAKRWLLDHDLSFADLDDLVDLIERVRYHQGYVGNEPEYDRNFGDTRLCECGHTYYRHFDSYENMDPVGYKYCARSGLFDDEDRQELHGGGYCAGFKLTKQREHGEDCACKSCVGM